MAAARKASVFSFWRSQVSVTVNKRAVANSPVRLRLPKHRRQPEISSILARLVVDHGTGADNSRYFSRLALMTASGVERIMTFKPGDVSNPPGSAIVYRNEILAH